VLDFAWSDAIANRRNASTVRHLRASLRPAGAAGQAGCDLNERYEDESGGTGPRLSVDLMWAASRNSDDHHRGRSS
jgi:hypothetical protein